MDAHGRLEEGDVTLPREVERRRLLQGLETMGRSLGSLPMRAEKALMVPAWDSCSLQDMEVPEEHGVVHLQMAIFMPGT